MSPAVGQAGDRSDRARFPEIADEIGEDPARFLDRSLLEHGVTRQQIGEGQYGREARLVNDDAVSPYGVVVRARIRGIDDRGVIDRWLEVENRLDRGPRETVVDLLHERAAQLDEIGERPDRLSHGPRQSHQEWKAGDPPGDADALREDRDLRRASRGGSASRSSEASGDDGGRQATLGSGSA